MRGARADAAGGGEIPELAALADGSLAPERRVELEARVAASPELAARLAEQRRAVTLTRSAAADVELPAGLRARIEAQQGARRRPTRRRLVLVGVAATAVAAVAFGIAIIGDSTPGQEFHAALTPSGYAPGATGQASMYRSSSGWRIELDATGLPRRDNGRYYEAWLGNRSGVQVPIGTFNEGSNVTLWAGVSPEGFTTMTVTREQGDDDQASSGEKVLVGTVEAGD